MTASAAGLIMQQPYFYFVADAFFKAAASLVPEVPRMINVDGKMRPSDAFLLEFLCNFFSTLLVVPVSCVWINRLRGCFDFPLSKFRAEWGVQCLVFHNS